MAPKGEPIKRTVIGINNSFSQKQLERILTQLGSDKSKVKEAKIKLVPSQTKSNYIKLIEEITATGTVAFYFFVYRKRLNFVCEKAEETEKTEYSGFRAYTNKVKETDTTAIKQFEEDRPFKNKGLLAKFQNALSPAECYDMDPIEEIYKTTENEEDKIEVQPQIGETPSDEGQGGVNPDNKNLTITEIEQEKPSTPMRKSTTNFNVEAKITPTDLTFNQMLNESIGAPNVTNNRQFNNQYIKKINLDEYNFDTDNNRNPNDWLANALFCLTLEDRNDKLNEGEKIATLMRALKGNLKETMFAKLRETPARELTLQKFQELFRKHTTKSIREIENRLGKVSKSQSGSYQDLYMQIENLIIEQMMVSGITKSQLNKEVIQAMTERLFKKKCHQNSETFQTSSKTGQELIDLADELSELSESKGLNAISKILPEKPLGVTTERFANEETRKCYRCKNPGHLIADCKQPDTRPTRGTAANTQQSYRRNWGNNQQNGWQNSSQQNTWQGNNQQQRGPDNRERNTWQGGQGGGNSYQQGRDQTHNAGRYGAQLRSSNFTGNYQRGGYRNNNWENNTGNGSYNRSPNFDSRRGGYRSGRGDWQNRRY